MYGYGYSLYNRTPFLSGGGAAPVNSVAPVISGTQTVGQTLTSTTGTWTGIPAPTFTYQWYRGASLISGATSSTYVLVQADAGNTTAIKCVVTATNSAGVLSADSNTLTGILDANAAAYLTATGITGTTQRNAVNTLNIGLKQDGLWSKMKAVYPFVTDNRNLFGYTEQLNNTSFWGYQGATITANTTTAPNGTLTADSLIENNTNAEHYIGIQSGLTLTAVPYTMSVYLKKAGRDWCSLSLFNGIDAKYAWFNLNTGTIGTINSGITANMESVGNGWYRCSITRTMAANSNNYIGIASALTDGSTAYLGNGSTSIYAWGAQLELGSTATTYQPIATTQQAFISNQFKYNLVNPVDSDAAFRLVFNGGWTHSANGAQGNGVNGWANTYINAQTNLTNGNFHLSSYSRTNLTLQAYSAEIQLASTYTSSGWISLRTNDKTLGISGVCFGDDTNEFVVASNTTSGFMVGTETSNSLRKVFKNNSLLGQNTTTSSTTITSSNLTLLGASSSTYSSNQVAFTSIGNGLTDTEAANLYTRVQAFQTALSRQV